MDKAFSGDIEIQDDEWQLHAKQFIVREGEISFHFVGHHAEWGIFEAKKDAKAKYHADSGFWIGRDLPLKYDQCMEWDGDIFSIRIEKCEVKNDSRCEIEGIWFEENFDDDSDGNSKKWHFKGVLTKFKPDESDY